MYYKLHTARKPQLVHDYKYLGTDTNRQQEVPILLGNAPSEDSEAGPLEGLDLPQPLPAYVAPCTFEFQIGRKLYTEPEKRAKSVLTGATTLQKSR